MAIYFKASATWKIAEDSTLAQLLSSRSFTSTEESDYDEVTNQYIEIADGASDQAIAFGGLTTANALLIISDREISVKINGSSTALPIGHTATEGGELLLPATAITSLTVSNASGGSANVYISMAGV